jgi:hypothetical protein
MAMAMSAAVGFDADQGRRAEPNRDVEDVHSGTI